MKKPQEFNALSAKKSEAALVKTKYTVIASFPLNDVYQPVGKELELTRREAEFLKYSHLKEGHGHKITPEKLAKEAAAKKAAAKKAAKKPVDSES